ncbi:GRAM domain-containing protein [Priestia megaterium]|uniref:GRAM domain-containing protein n=1 Tax=Priestia megaterium TaxID=1404 RepID=UPI0013E3F4C7|nr:GRAM domain-containing protein [Priestia megaterium]MED3866238.1 GRAM domain-containing protein [Priestia megaterium]MED4097840.1 GRAM domain-containing protein [Priestia megaterium]MED4141874.1 GRAM domain-containing protein [Priestia megaterium]MED4169312.1 GRAM domain-containing protein [Priestia megaterium]MED4199819.1 GRAM domain-containing protein [Priestia megaterium]
MSLKERATKEFKEKIDSDEEIRESILTYYECESGFSGLVGVPNVNSVPIRGVLAYTEKSLLFYGEVFSKLPIVLHIPFNKIREIKTGKQILTIFKSTLTMVVVHNDQEVFSTRGNKEDFSRLKSFFKNVNEEVFLAK